MRRQLFALGFALVLGLGATACASTPENGTRSDETMIRVENYNSLLVSVEAISNGVDYNLGQVETADTETFRLPTAAADGFDLRVRIDPIGSVRTYTSDEIVYTPGDVIHVEVESNLRLTTVTIQ